MKGPYKMNSFRSDSAINTILILIVFSLCSTKTLFGNCELREKESVSENENKNEDETKESTSPPSISTTSSSTLISTTTTKPSEDSDIPEGESRAVSGKKIQRTPPYVGHIFGPSPANLSSDHEHGRLSGFALHVNHNHAIVHQDTLSSFQAASDDEINLPKAWAKAHIVVPAKETVHVNMQGAPISLHRYTNVQTNLGGSHFNLAKFGWSAEGRWQLPPIEHPKLERSKQEFGDSCHMLAYSNSARSRIDLPKFVITPYTPGIKQDMAEIHLFKPDPKTCNNGLCHMTINRHKSPLAGICNHLQDFGAPIFCGHEKKVTYLAQPNGRTSNDCGQVGFKAFHVPHLIGDVEKHVKLD